MSSNNSCNESPNHFIVLDAISRGMKKANSIARVTKLSKDEVELIVNDLNAQKVITTDVKRGFFGNKKTEIHISETGMRILSTKKQSYPANPNIFNNYTILAKGAKFKALWTPIECGCP